MGSQKGGQSTSIEPGKPRQNGAVLSFHGRFPFESLTWKQVLMLQEASECMQISTGKAARKLHIAQAMMRKLSAASGKIQYPTDLVGFPLPAPGVT